MIQTGSKKVSGKILRYFACLAYNLAVLSIIKTYSNIVLYSIYSEAIFTIFFSICFI